MLKSLEKRMVNVTNFVRGLGSGVLYQLDVLSWHKDVAMLCLPLNDAVNTVPLHLSMPFLKIILSYSYLFFLASKLSAFDNVALRF